MDDKKKQKRDESQFLEAPFVRMLRMRSASLKKPLNPKQRLQQPDRAYPEHSRTLKVM